MAQESVKKQWHSGGGMYRGVNVSVKLLNYVIVIFLICLVFVVLYLGKTSNFQVSYEVNGGSDIANTVCKYGDTLQPPTPTKMGYDFAGWYLDENLEKPWQEDIIVESSGTLFAKWTPKQIKIKFDGGLEQINEQFVTFDKPYGSLPVVNSEGCTFVGWMYNGQLINENTIVTMNGEHVLTAYFENN